MWFFRSVSRKTRLSFLIAGQSNASGRGLLAGKETGNNSVFMFANDYNTKLAFEPVDDATGQLDSVSDDLWTVASTFGHSFALRAGKSTIANNEIVTLIPCAKGSTTISQWMPSADRYDRSTLYGSANYRHDQALAGRQLTAIWYYGHESNSTSPANRATYAADFNALIDEFRADWGADTPLIYCQLAKHTTESVNNGQHLVADTQRLQETGSGDVTEMSNAHMVVTFDLSLIDVIHLDQTALKTLGDRIALATREHVLGQDVNGTGPRITSIAQSGDSLIIITTSRTLATISANADDQFRVFDSGGERTITGVLRGATTTQVEITISGVLLSGVTVSYGDVVASGTGVTYSNVVKDEDGLPLPQFAQSI